MTRLLLRDVALRVAAGAGFALYSVFVGVFAGLTAVFFNLHLSRHSAVTQIVRAFNRLVHTGPLPRYGALST
jgi:hypothetical protein